MCRGGKRKHHEALEEPEYESDQSACSSENEENYQPNNPPKKAKPGRPTGSRNKETLNEAVSIVWDIPERNNPLYHLNGSADYTLLEDISELKLKKIAREEA